jgi:predicted nuclease of predicted toxin-antitoxin system
LRLLLDEMYSPLIARELRTRGHDAVSVHEEPGSGTADEDVLDYARSQQRALLTENVRDYRPLGEALISVGEGHSGLVFTTEKRWPRRTPVR